MRLCCAYTSLTAYLNKICNLILPVVRSINQIMVTNRFAYMSALPLRLRLSYGDYRTSFRQRRKTRIGFLDKRTKRMKKRTGKCAFSHITGFDSRVAFMSFFAKRVGLLSLHLAIIYMLFLA